MNPCSNYWIDSKKLQRKDPVGIKHVVLNGKIAVENGIPHKEDYGITIRHHF